MARRSRIRRRLATDSDDERDEAVAIEAPEAPVVEDTVPLAVLDDEEPADDAAGGNEDDGDDDIDGDGVEAATAAPSTPTKGKRKRAEAATPSTALEEAELARRRRRRQSLVFQKRRQSLTPSKSASTGSEQAGQSRQYITDMYSTIIKMSSENKINIKNTWSLHLIDHMEDILASPAKERPDTAVAAEDSNTFNFQKASCTLDASIKIYSYRVDDTWTSSYKILENLSRSGNDKRTGGDDHDGDGDDDANDDDAEDGEGGAASQRRNKKKASARKVGSAARTIEKNLNNITVKNYELDFEPDPLFHKMSQTFDEGGAKGMLLANLSVYDGAKILLNSADVKLSTRKPMTKIVAPVTTTPEAQEGGESPPPEVAVGTIQSRSKISLSVLGKLPCFAKDVTPLTVCPLLRRLYDQIETLRDPEMTQSKVVLRSSVLTFAPRGLPVDQFRDDSSLAPSSPLPDNVSVAASTENTDEQTDSGDVAMDGGATDEPEEPLSENVDATHGDDEVRGDGGDEAGDDDDENNEPDDQGFDFGGGGDDGDVDMEEADATASVAASQPVDQAGEGSVEENASVQDVDEYTEEHEPISDRHVDPVSHPKIESTQVVIKSAADYFRIKTQDDSVKNEADVAYSQLIETALMRSVVLESNGANPDDQSDYSYFDAKLLKNWAGPSHYKFKGPRKITAKLLAFDEEVDGAVHDGTAPTKRGRKTQAKKTTALAAVEKRSLLVDFMSTEVPDLNKLLRAPRLNASSVLSTLVVRKQLTKSSDLVFPVDAHIEPKLFFRHFMKPRLHLFHRRVIHTQAGGGTGPGGMASSEEMHLSMLDPSASDPALADTDHLAYEDSGNNYGSHDFGGVDDYSDDDTASADDHGGSSGGIFSSVNLVAAERVVEKIDVHYERVAKRVDVKKLKTSLWSHLETETRLLGGKRGLLGKRHRRSAQKTGQQPEPEASDDVHSEEDEETGNAVSEPTDFDSVVHGIAGRVPSNVTVSFYFICMLHLANEKGLRLTGQDDLSNFEIKKE